MKKQLAGVLSVVLLHTQVVFAYQPQKSFWQERQKQIQYASLPLPPHKSLGSSSALLPEINTNSALTKKTKDLKGADRLARITPHVTFQDNFNGKSDRTILLLQDIHQNQEAQTQLSSALKALVEGPGKGAVVVGLEGAHGHFLYDLYKKFSDRKAATQVADEFFQAGDISGPAHAGFTSYQQQGHPSLFFWGIEDPDLYRKNVQAYRNSHQEKKSAQRQVNALISEIRDQKKSVYSKSLLAFDQKLSSYRQGTLSLADYVEALRLHAPTLSLQLQVFLEAARMEKSLNFSRIEKERPSLLERLLSRLTPAETNELLSRSVSLERRLETYGQYYQWFRRLCEQHEISLSDTPAFDDYIRYVLLTNELRADELMESVKRLEDQVLNQLAGSPSALELAQRDQYAFLAGRLLEFGLTPQEWVQYQTRKRDVRPLNLSTFESFYQAADARNEKLADNLLSVTHRASLVAPGTELAVLVVGGYHTPGITEVFKRKNISYVVASPKISKVETAQGSAYLSVFDQEKTSLEKILSGEKLFLSAVPAGTARSLIPWPSVLLRMAERVKTLSRNFNALDEKIAERLREHQSPQKWLIAGVLLGGILWSTDSIFSFNLLWGLLSVCFLGAVIVGQGKGGSDQNSQVEILKELGVNFDPRFQARALALLEKGEANWTAEDRQERDALMTEARKAHDWMMGWIKKSPHYANLKGNPPILISLEGIISAIEENSGRRLTSYAGGLGVLFGEWVRAIAYLGGTSFDPDPDAPQFTIIIPNYSEGVKKSHLSWCDIPLANERVSVRPQNYGIDRLKEADGSPLQVEIPVSFGDEGVQLVKVEFSAVSVGNIKIAMPMTDIEGQPDNHRTILRQLYDGELSSETRFRQEWVIGLSAYELRKKWGLTEGPIHLNETATFAYLIGMIREVTEEYVKQGAPLSEAYDLALERVGSQIVFFTHTLVAAGIDKFYSEIRMLHYVRKYMSMSEVIMRSVDHDLMASWVVTGKTSDLGSKKLPSLLHRSHYSPLNFIVRLIVQSKGGSIVAVSKRNADKAREFIVEEGIIDKVDAWRLPLTWVTNGVDHLFWMNRVVAKVMNWFRSDPDQRTPWRILNPQDPLALEMVTEIFNKSLPSNYKKVGLKDRKLKRSLQQNKKKAIAMVRKSTKVRYLRVLSDLKEKFQTDGQHSEALYQAQYERVKTRWESYSGETLPLSLADLDTEEIQNHSFDRLLDSNLFLVTWARRIVEYKRILLTLFGEQLPMVERRIVRFVKINGQIDENDLGYIESAGNLADEIIRDLGDESLRRFVDLVLQRQTQFIFAGNAFSRDGRLMIFLLHRVIDHLAKSHPALMNRVVFLEGYNEEKSQLLVRGADAWLNTPRLWEEASGTSGMKGEAVPITSLDGWAATGFFPGLIGFGIESPMVGPDPDHPTPEHPKNWAPALNESSGDYREKLEERMDSLLAKEYLKQEAANLYDALNRAVDMKTNRPNDWLNLVRRWSYYRAMVYDIRGEITGRLVPDVSGTGSEKYVHNSDDFEPGILALYDKAIEGRRRIRRLHAVRLSPQLKDLFSRIKREFKFAPAQVQLNGQPPTLQFDFTADPELLSQVQIVAHWGNEIRGQHWRNTVIPAQNIARTKVDEKWVGDIKISETHHHQVTFQLPNELIPGDKYGVIFFVAPKEVPIDEIDIFRHWMDSGNVLVTIPHNISTTPDPIPHDLRSALLPMVGTLILASLDPSLLPYVGAVVGIVAISFFLAFLIYFFRGAPRVNGYIEEFGKELAQGKFDEDLLMKAIQSLAQDENFIESQTDKIPFVDIREKMLVQLADAIRQSTLRDEIIVRIQEVDILFNRDIGVRKSARRILKALDVYNDLENQVNMAGSEPPSIDLMSRSILGGLVGAWVPSILKALRHGDRDLIGAAYEVSKSEKIEVEGIKDRIDIVAMYAFQYVFKKYGITGKAMASEGEGRDEVKAIVAGELVAPPVFWKRISLNLSHVFLLCLLLPLKSFGFNVRVPERFWEIPFSVDVVENTNAASTNNKGKEFSRLSSSEGGATTPMVYGPGVASLGIMPDVYADLITTSVPEEFKSQFDDLDPMVKDDPLQHDIPDENGMPTAGGRNVYHEVKRQLEKIASANNIGLGEIEVIWLNRGKTAKDSDGHRDTLRGRAFEKIADETGLTLSVINDGTLDAAISAGIGRKEGKHLVFWGTSGSPEAMQTLQTLAPFFRARQVGVPGLHPRYGRRVAVAAMRFYSKNINHAQAYRSKEEAKSKRASKDAIDMRNRFHWMENERLEIAKNPFSQEILDGNKVFRLNDVKGSIHSIRGLITDSGIYSLRGAIRIPNASNGQPRYAVHVVHVSQETSGKPTWWVEKVVVRDPLSILPKKFRNQGDAKNSQKNPTIEKAQSALLPMLGALFLASLDPSLLPYVGAVVVFVLGSVLFLFLGGWGKKGVDLLSHIIRVRVLVSRVGRMEQALSRPEQADSSSVLATLLRLARPKKILEGVGQSHVLSTIADQVQSSSPAQRPRRLILLSLFASLVMAASNANANQSLGSALRPSSNANQSEVVSIHVGERALKPGETIDQYIQTEIKRLKGHVVSLEKGYERIIFVGDGLKSHSAIQSRLLDEISHDNGLIVPITDEVMVEGSVDYNRLLMLADRKAASGLVGLNALADKKYGEARLVTITENPGLYTGDEDLMKVWTLVTLIGSAWVSVHMGAILEAAQMAAKHA